MVLSQPELLFTFDEARFGLKSWYRRRWAPTGVRAPWPTDDRYQWLWLYAAVEPASGNCFFLTLPYVNSACMNVFMKEMANAFSDREILLVMDNAPSHTSGALQWPKNIAGLHLPPYSPELNPAERLFQELREPLANEVFEDVDHLESRLTDTLRPYWETPKLITDIAGYPWLLNAVELCSHQDI
ncbi:MAG: IS630 family transposase [Magnetococcales bacterium]|nr:IS630 family transposase [Magnetococcales bacterium]